MHLGVARAAGQLGTDPGQCNAGPLNGGVGDRPRFAGTQLDSLHIPVAFQLQRHDEAASRDSPLITRDAPRALLGGSGS